MAEERSKSRRFLPPDPRVSEPYRLTPQLALRIGILGGVAVLVFGVLFFRLWALQVLSGSQYLEAAQNNQLRTRRIEAPRGPILDRNGRVLVSNVAGTAVRLWPADLPRKGRYAELQQLSKIVHVPVSRMVAAIRQRADDPIDPVIVKTGVHEDQVNYLSEHQAQFPGVDVADTYIRRYPYQSLAAQVLGYVREISREQLKQDSKKGYRPGDRIGQSGVEATYDTYLRGRSGLADLTVDSLGRPTSDLKPVRKPQPGHAIRLTIDIGLQRTAERAIRYGIEIAHQDGEWAADGGAIVALDPRNGEVLALASNPTYKPSLFTGRVDPKKLARAGLTNATAPEKNFPGLNRATAGLYPAGSTFKPVTALAAMQEHVVSAFTPLECTGSITIAGHRFNNWDPYANSSMTMPTAIAASCDTFFYQLGKFFYDLPPERGHPLQAWASRFGFGQRTGIDVGPEESGLLPTPGWRQKTFTAKTDPCCWEIDRLWKPGDSVQLAIGQKDLLVTPLQMARFYAMVANGGKLVTPHVVADAEQPGNDTSPAVVLRRFSPPPPLATGVDQTALAVVRDGLYQAAHASYGTSSGIFGSYQIPIAGKTGTAEKVVRLPGYPNGLLLDQSWWCGYGPSNDPELVVCALIENGGHGGTAAAPAALKVFEKFFGIAAGQQGSVYSD